MAPSDPETWIRDLLAHREKLRDAATKGKITGDTELVALAKINKNNAKGRLVWNLSNIAEPAEPCTLILDEGIVFPPTPDSGDYQISVTFRELWMAPAVRLECNWNWMSNTSQDLNLKLALEFYFNALSDDIQGIKDEFRVEKDVLHQGTTADEITFMCYGAACEGFNWIGEYNELLGFQGLQMAYALFKLIKPPTPQKVRLRFFKRLRENNSALAGLLRYLPGGEGPLLPSFSLPDWSMYFIDRFAKHQVSPPLKLMNAKVPHPMVPFGSYDTFSSLKAAAREFKLAAHYSYLEQDLAMKLWAEKPHRGRVYRVGAIAVMAVRFNDFKRLGSINDEVKFGLPDNLFIQMEWYDDFNKKRWWCDGKLTTAPIRLPENDAVFTITNRQAESFSRIFLPPIHEHSRWFSVKFLPHSSTFTVYSQRETANQIMSSNTNRWHPVILNQLHSGLKTVDLAVGHGHGSDDSSLETRIEEGYQWLMQYCRWNVEQVEALKRIRNAVGGIILICGPAGCGKTLVQQAICVFLYRLGIHVLALSPANSNCTDFIRKLHENFPDVNGLRVFPASTEIKLKDINEGRAMHDERGHIDGHSTSLIDFEMIRAEVESQNNKYNMCRDFGLQAQVLEAARGGMYTLEGHLKDKEGKRMEPKVDLWAVLRRCIQDCDTGNFNWSDLTSVLAYKESYKQCKGHYIGHSNFLVTTTGNVRCAEIIDFWAQDHFGTKCSGIVIVLDEACKDKEIDTLTALLSKEFQDKIVGMVMLGDEKQLEPTNKSSKGSTIFNPFPQRESIPLLSRLKRQGFKSVDLKEQHRMNHHISYWPFKNFYPEGMRNAPSTYATLEERQPGLRKCLLQFLRDYYDNGSLQLDDGALRTHYLEIDGNRMKDAEGSSSVVRGHILIFFDTIFWYLHAYYGTAMAENVMIIVAYREARRWWNEASAWMQRRYNLSGEDMPSLTFLPNVKTIDSAQGQEAPVVFLDCSVQEANSRRHDIGFVDDDKRMNVAFTRAKDVFYILGGNCFGAVGGVDPPAYIRYKEWLEEEGRLLHMNNAKIKQKGSGWIDGLKKKEVNVVTTFADDCARLRDGGSGNA